jgi:hypothetical protein
MLPETPFALDGFVEPGCTEATLSSERTLLSLPQASAMQTRGRKERAGCAEVRGR